GVDPSTVRQINNFTEIDNEAVAVKRKEFNTPDEATVIVSLARYHPVKALDILVRAMKDLPDSYLWLAGDGPLRKDLEAQAKDLGVEERVKFLGWRDDRDELLRAADICAFVSRHEGFGNVFVQAWGNKVPVIVSDAQGPRQFCTHEQDCLMVPKDNSTAIAESVKRLQSDKVLAMKIVNEGHQNYQENFTKEKSVEHYLQFYKDVLSAPQSMHVENQDTNQKKSIQLM
ncbi:MAG: glycosyltransferase family 4 protein, partial [Pseudomonadota bacterium]